jgi:hypothetical protein
MENYRRSNSRSHGRRNRDELQSYSPLHPNQHDVAMHELSIAVNIVEIAEEELARHGGEKVRAVHLQLGSLAGVATEALSFSFGLACEGTAAEGSRLIVEPVEGRDLVVVRMEIE